MNSKTTTLIVVLVVLVVAIFWIMGSLPTVDQNVEQNNELGITDPNATTSNDGFNLLAPGATTSDPEILQ